ncbi:ead/Ea22-like family protein [Escherichia coli]|nr:ead/Ea22-like family protein [Escherichia coli]TFN92630.1 ead/Ea22-like family protein [Escherichia coli]
MSEINYQALREAAVKAGKDKWQAKKINGDFFVIRHGSYTRQHGYTSYQPIAEIDCKSVRDFVAKANPATVLELLDERERNQQYIKRRDQENEEIALTVGKLRVELEAAENNLIDSECHVAELEEALRDKQALLEASEKRIAELEAREIKPAKGEVLVVVSGFTGCGKSAIAGEIEIAMKAIGVPVKWTNGDAEKRMTGADWLTAIEMYKPTVRIVEVNVPRAAGIRIKGE